MLFNFQTAGRNVAKWVAMLMASGAHERNWDIPKKCITHQSNYSKD